MDDLIGRWIAGDANAGEQLYRAYFVRLKEFIIGRGASVNDAEEAAQEAMIAGLDGLKLGKRPDRLTGWLLGIAKHKASNALERRLDKLDPWEDVEDPGRSARSVVIRKEMGGVLEKTLGRLSATDRQILDLEHRAGLSRKEIAEKLKISIDAVQRRCERAHARLRQALTRHFTTVALPRIAREPLTLGEIRDLRPAFRQVIVTRHLEDLADPAAALRLAIPEATYRARLHSAYELLKCDATADFSQARAEYHKEKGIGREGEIGR